MNAYFFICCNWELYLIIKNLNIDVKNMKNKNHLIKFELLAILFLVFFILISCSLISYSPSDIQVYYQEKNVSIKNFIGPVGIIISNFLINFFGILAYILPLILLFFSVLFVKKIVFNFSCFQVFWILLWFFSIAIILSLFEINIDLIPYPLAGTFGGFFAYHLQNRISLIGAFTISISINLASILFCFRYHSIKLFKKKMLKIRYVNHLLKMKILNLHL